MIGIDGLEFDALCEVVRTAQITPSSISGLMLDKSYFNDVIGTYMSYDVALKYPLYDQDIYARFYELLTAPVDGHRFVVPYNQATIEVTGRVTEVSDSQLKMDSGRVFWRELNFTIVANHPSKEMSLGETLARGRAPLPELAAVETGVIYMYTSTGWVRLNLETGAIYVYTSEGLVEQDWQDADAIVY